MLFAYAKLKELVVGQTRWSSFCRERKSTLVEVVFFNIYTDDIIMDLFVLWKTNGPATQAFDMVSEIEVFPFNFPGAALTDQMSIVIGEQTAVSRPVICVINLDRHKSDLIQKPL